MSNKDNWYASGQAAKVDGAKAPTYQAPPSYQQREMTNAGWNSVPKAPPPPPTKSWDKK